ncbi:competence/damage-inducible protein CinA-like protein [Desulfosporosinus acidiphilus SJ4]|uniref:Competence/damage-inducible protein CinA-like protein n=1 Tax=Desulfosporosinus acidiphilus (strain DSM 22704 / JCM 16185 / SJ4) TaxID=646529 RepID=I4D6K2_DESAJ|nr:nicotinamide-nucleotide amidohydrolase family protein [Desulfosporosinus acidiphilus]AFM41426.1 competence/damage-inducible protein CinA-like protein [Desulfosporosinus acidiphilus SJ4]
MNAERVVALLNELSATITTVESCTGGHIISSITDVEGASNVTPGGYVTYSNRQKLAIGVPEVIIEKYGVYSLECAKAMAIAGQKNTQADFSIGVTGTFTTIDLHNEDSEPGVVYFAVVFKAEQAIAEKINVPVMRRTDQKQFITEIILRFP